MYMYLDNDTSSLVFWQAATKLKKKRFILFFALFTIMMRKEKIRFERGHR